MKRQIIAVDIDDVLSSQVDIIIEFSNQKYGLNLSHKDFSTPGEYWGYYEKVWGVGEEEGAKRFEEFLAGMYPLTQVVSPEAKDAIQRLKKSYDLEIVTSRGVDYQNGTLQWLEDQVPDVFKGVHFVALWGNGNEKATKAKICQEIGAGYLIDDSVEHCNLAAEAGVTALLFGEWGWSKAQHIHKDVVRVVDWREVLEYFDDRRH